eukprot:GHVS01011652.1.p1 GENE.GHVS01011652.1~~GHVS01011652.1.p1  ORF type:complete len:249 (+),score=53.06 GHVS01011652.1:182-928(+)
MRTDTAHAQIQHMHRYSTCTDTAHAQIQHMRTDTCTAVHTCAHVQTFLWCRSTSDTFLIECYQTIQAPLHKMLQRYQLRSEVKLTALPADCLDMFQLIPPSGGGGGGGGGAAAASSSSEKPPKLSSGGLPCWVEEALQMLVTKGIRRRRLTTDSPPPHHHHPVCAHLFVSPDHRYWRLGYKVLAPFSVPPTDENDDWYQMYRFACGVYEQQVPNQKLPLNLNMDFLGYLHNRKGLVMCILYICAHIYV